MDILWFTLDWPWLVFVVAVAFCAFVIVKVGQWTGLLLLALVVYGGTAWNPWAEWIPNLFWLVWLIGLVGVVWGLINGGGRLLAVWGAVAALMIGLVLASGGIFSTEEPSLEKRLSEIETRLKMLEDHKDGQGDLRKDLTWLDGRITELEGQLSKK